MSEFVVDASALLGLLLDEEPARKVENLLASSVMSAVNFSETVAKLTDIDIPEKKVREILERLPMEIYPFDKNQAYISGLLRATTKTRGLSLGDRACLSLGIVLGHPVVTMDKAWRNLNIGVEIEVLN